MNGQAYKLHVHVHVCCFFRQKVKGPAKIVDTGAGFFLEEEDEEDKLMAKIQVKHAPGIHFVFIFVNTFTTDMYSSTSSTLNV